MGFILYNSAVKPLLAYDDSSNEMDFDTLTIQYGKVQMLVDMDTIPVLKLNQFQWSK
jgi:hypothetical protein